MQRVSKAGFLFVGVFGLPFLLAGLAVAAKTWQSAGNSGNPAAYIGIAFGGVFALAGLGLIALAVGGYRTAKRQEAVEAANPDGPWLWRADWAEGRSSGSGRKGGIALWSFAIFWDLISFTIAAALLPKLLAKGDLRLLLVVIFPLVGIILTAAATVSTIRMRRYGRTAFWFATLPFSPGGRVNGVIHLKMPTTVPHGVDVRLSCIRRVVTGSGNNRSTSDTVLWQDERNIPAASVISADDAQIPIDFSVSPDATPCDGSDPNNRILWILHAHADVPGVDYKDDYEIPVFRTGRRSSTTVTDTSNWIDSGAHNRDAAAATAVQTADEPVVLPASTHIVITEDGASTRVYFPPLRNPGQALALVAFACAWTGVVYFLFTHPTPWLFRIVFGAAELLIGYGLINVIFGSSLIAVAEGTLTIRNAIMGIGIAKSIPLDGVQSITPVSQGQPDASGAAKFGIFIQLTDGQVFKVAASSLSRVEARWIVAGLDRATGRKVDVSPEFKPVAMTSPTQTTGVVRIGGVRATSISRAIGIIFFAGWILFVGRFALNMLHRAPVKTTSPPAAIQRINFVSMTDEDESRILALAMQEQAEELLERSIRHDERALRLFEERVDGWTSEIHLTDRMRRLEDQSRYSTDLRVRHANEDIELALDGWHKDQHAVDLLIERAQSDEKYKAAALYFLGMEGGRGVDTQHVFQVLREYALHDPDGASRQWAVEGLRFLQTEEAQATLWESFTTDPSFTVRDRAGCNLSDCGVFTREQRMRYVPKFLALLNGTSLNPQMRAWCFMALREITDVSLPDDAAAWNRWYNERGEERLSQFRGLPWYQVRGDQ